MDISKEVSSPRCLPNEIHSKDKNILYARKPPKVLAVPVHRKTSDTSVKNLESSGKLVTMIRKIKPDSLDPKTNQNELLLANSKSPLQIANTSSVNNDDLDHLVMLDVQKKKTDSLESFVVDTTSVGKEPDDLEMLEIEPMIVESEDVEVDEMNHEMAFQGQLEQGQSNSSSSDEEDNNLAEQFFELEQKYKEKEAKAHLVTKTKLEALEAGIKFLGAFLNFTGLGALRVPVKRNDNPTTTKEVASTSTANTTPKVISHDAKAEQSHVQSNVTTAVPPGDEEFDLGIFNPAELTRKMKQFISQEDITGNPETTKRKYRRFAKTKFYKHHRRREFSLQNWEQNIYRTSVNKARKKDNMASNSSNITGMRMRRNEGVRRNPVGRPRKNPKGVENNQQEERQRKILHRINAAKRVAPKEKKIEMSSSIDLPVVAVSSETDEERNRRLLELSNATGSQSIKHQMMRNTCIDDLFQSSLFHSSDL